MQYNIHPIFVHFPIALLFIYSAIKILPLNKFLPKIAWKDIERILLLGGVFGAFVALSTGEAAEHLIRPNHQLVEAHSTFASLSTIIYCVLLAGEIAAFINARNFIYTQSLTWLASIMRLIEKIFCNRTFSIILAICGFIAITLTGMLGGVLVYGLTADPFAKILVNILGIKL